MGERLLVATGQYFRVAPPPPYRALPGCFYLMTLVNMRLIRMHVWGCGKWCDGRLRKRRPWSVTVRNSEST